MATVQETDLPQCKVKLCAQCTCMSTYINWYNNFIKNNAEINLLLNYGSYPFLFAKTMKLKPTVVIVLKVTAMVVTTNKHSSSFLIWSPLHYLLLMKTVLRLNISLLKNSIFTYLTQNLFLTSVHMHVHIPCTRKYI